jgi:hypothetical protein
MLEALETRHSPAGRVVQARLACSVRTAKQLATLNKLAGRIAGHVAAAEARPGIPDIAARFSAELSALAAEAGPVTILSVRVDEAGEGWLA